MLSRALPSRSEAIVRDAFGNRQQVAGDGRDTEDDKATSYHGAVLKGRSPRRFNTVVTLVLSRQLAVHL